MTTAALLKRYAIVAAITFVALLVIGVVLQVYAGFDIGSGGAIVGTLVPALDAGQTYARRTKHMPAKGYMWRMAAVFVVINEAIGAVLFALLVTALGGLGLAMAMLAEQDANFAIIAAVVFVIHWLASRFFFWFGARNELKLQERLASKGPR